MDKKSITSVNLSLALLRINEATNFIEDIWLSPDGLSDKDLELVKSVWRRLVNIHSHLSPVFDRINNSCN